MDTKRAIGGFCTFVGGAVVNVIQATQPTWFGDHAWILPASFVVLLVGLLVWLCQYRWTQKLLGIAESNASQDSGGNPWKTKEHWRLKYETETSEVKRLQQAHDEDARKLHEALARVSEMEECKKRLALFCRLQWDALQFAHGLRKFLQEEILSFPPQLDDLANTPINDVHRRTDERIAWRKRVESKYELQFAEAYGRLLLRFKAIGIEPDRSFYHQGVSKIEADIPARMGIIIAMVHEIDGVKLSARP